MPIPSSSSQRSRPVNVDHRFLFLRVVLFAFFFVMALRLGYLQILKYGIYSLYASDSHEIARKLQPTRGSVFVRDRTDGALHPLATNRLSWDVYVVPKDVAEVNREQVISAVTSTLQLDTDEVRQKVNKKDDPYEPLAKDVDDGIVQSLKEQKIEGLGYVSRTVRSYPEKRIGGQLVGFVALDDAQQMVGKYGLESSLQEILSGTVGHMSEETDAGGRRLSFGTSDVTEAVNGSDVILTIDRGVQFQACDVIERAVHKHDADSGTLLVMDPKTGAIRAMCSYPDFDPTEYGKVKNISVLSNPAILSAYEPGSVFKAFTMAAGIDAKKVSPETTYVDTGAEKIDRFTIKNSDGKAHGLSTMIQVLDESLNTGTIFVMRSLGADLFRKYIERFGFGARTGIEISPESKGTIASLSKSGEIFPATASFGQGLTTTPIQLLSAYGAIANGGKLMRPYVVDEIVHPDGRREKTKPQVLSEPITERASRIASGMLVSVVEKGHGKRAGVPGYWVAGKTGTAQVVNPQTKEYYKDVTVGSFAGFAPVPDPTFVMLVRIDHPRDVQWAESSAAPVFGEMAAYLLNADHVPPVRPITKPVESTSTSSTYATTSTNP